MCLILTHAATALAPDLSLAQFTRPQVLTRFIPMPPRHCLLSHLAVCCMVSSAVFMTGHAAYLNAQTAGSVPTRQITPGSGSHSPWDVLASIAHLVDGVDPHEANPFPGWTSNCTLWPKSTYCVGNNPKAPLVPVGDFNLNLPVYLPPISNPLNRTVIDSTVPQLGETILYNDSAKQQFGSCKFGQPARTHEQCQSVATVHSPAIIVRALWAEVSPSLPVVIFMEKEVDECQLVNWPASCPTIRREVNLKVRKSCNLEDYPWTQKSIDLGCFPHILVTHENVHSFPLAPAPVPRHYVILLAFHVMRILPSGNAGSSWQQMTFWWQAKPSDSGIGTGCSEAHSCSKLGQQWQHFRMWEAVLPEDWNKPIPPAYNPYIDTPLGDQKESSCAVCHAFAAYRSGVLGEAPTTGMRTDYTRSTLDQAVRDYQQTYCFIPSAEIWSLALGVASVAPPQPRGQSCKGAPPTP